MLESPRQRHYLAQFYSGSDDAPSQYSKVNLVVRALYPARGMKSLHGLQVRIVSINEGGAILQSNNINYLPDHFYLSLGMQEIVLTCAKIRMDNTSMVVAFSKREDSAFIEALKRISFPLSTLRRLKGQGSLVIDARIDRRPGKN
ncbi:hypothetical protein [Rhizobium binxianense]